MSTTFQEPGTSQHGGGGFDADFGEEEEMDDDDNDDDEALNAFTQDNEDQEDDEDNIMEGVIDGDDDDFNQNTSPGLNGRNKGPDRTSAVATNRTHDEREGNDDGMVEPANDNGSQVVIEHESHNDEDDDDKTVGMEDCETNDRMTNFVATSSSPPRAFTTGPVANDATSADKENEDADAWLDDSGDEGDNWRKPAPSATDEAGRSDDDAAAAEENSFQGIVDDQRSVPASKSKDVSGKDGNDDDESPISDGTPYEELDDLIRATDEIFGLVDVETFTFKRLFTDLVRKQGGLKLTKAQKYAVKDRVKHLLKKMADNDGSDDNDDDTIQVSDQGDDASEYETDGNDGDDDDEAKPKRGHDKKKARKKAKRSEAGVRISRASKKPSIRKAARAARMIEQQRLRKKRMDELRIRNEEMQLNETKEDQARQEAIAAKFETNTDELRMKRLEDRLDLLHRLDEQRISVVEVGVKKEVADQQPTGNVPTKTDDPVVEERIESSEESSSDEEALEIVGIDKAAFKPLKRLHNHLPSRGINILDQIASPKGKKKAGRGAATNKSQLSQEFAPGRRKDVESMVMSPNRSMGARFALRNALKKKQRTVGNRWLARELGYKTEEEHLKDCKTAAEKKRELVIKLEQERLKANERKHLRERILLQDAKSFGDFDRLEDEENDNDQDYAAPGSSASNEEEDEEMQMAKEIEHEAKKHGPESDSSGDDSASTKTMDEEAEQTTVDGSSTLPTGDDGDEDENTEGALGSSKVDLSKGINGAGDSQTSSGRPLETQIHTQNQSQVMQNLEAGAFGVHSEADDEFTVNELVGMESQRLETQPTLETQQADVMDAQLDAKDNIDPGTSATLILGSLPLLETQTLTGVADHGKTAQAESSTVTKRIDEDPELVADVLNKEVAESGTERPRNAGWQAMLRRDEEKLKKMNRRKGGLVEEEAEEEEEEEVAGLEDFGFSFSKKKKDEDDEENPALDELDEDDLKHVVDDVSDDEGDEDAGMAARKRQEQQEEKERHNEILRRMREGYDGRRGGIAGGGAGARGMHRFDQLVAADNREDAKRLGLLNDDEMDSDDESNVENKSKSNDEDEDETALLDKMLKNRFLHRSDVDLEENFSEDEEEEKQDEGDIDNGNQSGDEEQKSQELLAKRFAKRARMQRLEDMYGDSQEFSQRRLIDEDVSMQEELSQMRNGLVRRRSTSSSISRNSQSSESNFGPPYKKGRSSEAPMAGQSKSSSDGSFFRGSGGSLSIALQASRKNKRRSTFLGGSKATNSKENNLSVGFVHKTVALSHVVFSSKSSRSGFGPNINPSSANTSIAAKNMGVGNGGSSMFSRISAGGRNKASN